MLGGHMDAWASSTGATDNGAGCIVMLRGRSPAGFIGLKTKTHHPHCAMGRRGARLT